jgi:hypothetical protein
LGNFSRSETAISFHFCLTYLAGMVSLGQKGIFSMDNTFPIMATNLDYETIRALLEADGAPIGPDSSNFDVWAAMRERNWFTQPIAQVPIMTNAGCDACGTGDRVQGSQFCEGCLLDPEYGGYFIPDRRPTDPGYPNHGNPKENTDG